MTKGLRLAFASMFVFGLAMLTACGSDSTVHTLSSFVALDDGGITASVSDSRLDKHTVWVVLPNPPKGSQREWLCLHHDGEGVTGGTVSAEVPAGTYTYDVYSVDGTIQGAGARYWIPSNRVADGQVTVP
jgi:hypothetical protein